MGNDGLYEVETRPHRVPQDMPTVLGVHVLSGAKLIMLQFYYDFLQKYLRCVCDLLDIEVTRFCFFKKTSVCV